MSDELDHAVAECAKLRDICAGANASKYHKDTYAKLQKKVAELTKKSAPKEGIAKVTESIPDDITN